MKCFFCIAVLFLLPLATQAQTIRSLGNPLVDAADQGIETLVAAQIRNGNNVNVKGDFGATPLIRAAYNNYTNIMEMLINMGADVNLADEGGATALHVAARQGNVEAVNLLIKYDAVLDMADAEGWTPLMRAAANQKKDVVALLVNAGADVQTKNEWGESPLILAEKSPEILNIMQQSHIAQKQKISAVEAVRQDIPVPVEQVLPSDLPPSGTGQLANATPQKPAPAVPTPATVNTDSDDVVDEVVLPNPKTTIPEAGVKLLKQAEEKILEQQGYLQDVLQRNLLKDTLAEAKVAREKAELQLKALQADRERQEAEARLLVEQKAAEEANKQAELLAQQKAEQEAKIAQARAEAEALEKARAQLLAEQQAAEAQKQAELAVQQQRAREAAILQAKADAIALEQARARMLAERDAAEEAERKAALLAEENRKREAELAQAKAFQAKQEEIAQRNQALIEQKAMEVAIAREQKATQEIQAKLQAEMQYQQQLAMKKPEALPSVVAEVPIVKPSQQTADIFIGEAVSVPVSSSPLIMARANPSPNLLSMNKGVWLQVGPFGEEPEAIAYYDKITNTMQELPRRMKVIASAFLLDSPPQNFLRVGPYTSQKVAEVACGFFRQGDLLCEYIREESERVRSRL